MIVLTPVAKVWYNFLCVKIKPLLYLNTVTKDKAIHLYEMTKGFQLDSGTVIEQGLIESIHRRYTKLCQSAGVPMLDSKEQVQQRLPIPLLRVKFGSLDESDDETDDDVSMTTPSASDLVDDDPEVPSSST